MRGASKLLLCSTLTHIEVSATVLDNRGHYVDGLNRGDFQILENDQPQKIKYF